MLNIYHDHLGPSGPADLSLVLIGPMVYACFFLDEGNSQVSQLQPTSLEKWDWLWGADGFL